VKYHWALRPPNEVRGFLLPKMLLRQHFGIRYFTLHAFCGVKSRSVEPWTFGGLVLKGFSSINFCGFYVAYVAYVAYEFYGLCVAYVICDSWE